MFGNVAWHRKGNKWENRPNQRRTGWVTNIQEPAATLSTTWKGEHAHASGTTGRSPTATERCPPEMAAAIHEAIRCYVRRFEGISIHAFEIGRGHHVHDVDASWETWETRNDDDRKPEFRKVHTGVTLDPITVGTARKEELQFADGLDA